MTTGSSCPVDYATQLAFQAHRASRKPIKNMGLGGSADTCIDTTRGELHAFRTLTSQIETGLRAAERRQVAFRRAAGEAGFEMAGRKVRRALSAHEAWQLALQICLILPITWTSARRRIATRARYPSALSGTRESDTPDAQEMRQTRLKNKTPQRRTVGVFHSMRSTQA